MPKYREHKDSKARLTRLKGLIANEPRVEGRLARKWSGIEEEIAQIKKKLEEGKPKGDNRR